MKMIIENGSKEKVAFNERQISPSKKYGHRPYVLYVSPLVKRSKSFLKKGLCQRDVRDPDYVNSTEQIPIITYVQAVNFIVSQHLDRIVNLIVNCEMIQLIDLTVIKSLPLGDRHGLF